MKPILKIILLAAASFALGLATGCSIAARSIELPEISAKTITYHRTDPAGGTKITATNVVDHGDKITADHMSVTTTYPSFSIDLQVEGYERKKEAKK